MDFIRPSELFSQRYSTAKICSCEENCSIYRFSILRYQISYAPLLMFLCLFKPLPRELLRRTTSAMALKRSVATQLLITRHCLLITALQQRMGQVSGGSCRALACWRSKFFNVNGHNPVPHYLAWKQTSWPRTSWFDSVGRRIDSALQQNVLMVYYLNYEKAKNCRAFSLTGHGLVEKVCFPFT